MTATAFDTGNLFSIDRALVSETLREQHAANEAKAAQETARKELLEGHKSLLLRILGDTDLKDLLLASRSSIEILPAFQDCEGNMLSLGLFICPKNETTQKYFPSAIGKLSLGIGSQDPITVETIVNGSSDERIEALFARNAFVDPVKAKESYTWLKGERTLTPQELVSIINEKVAALLAQLRRR